MFEVPEGSRVLIEAASYKGYDVAWEDSRGTRDIGILYRGPMPVVEIGEVSVTLTFTPIPSEDGRDWVWVWLLLAMLILLILVSIGYYILAKRREEEEEALK